LAKLIYSASEYDADMLYATRFFAPDPFVWVCCNGETHMMLSDLEVDRARGSSAVTHIHSMTELKKEAGLSGRGDGVAALVAYFFKANRISAVEVPQSFPFGLAEMLRKEGVVLKAAKDAFFPERLYKSHEEISCIEAAQKMAEVGMSRARDILRAANPTKAGWLKWKGRLLTSEIVQGEVNAAIAASGGVASHTIIAGGDQACDPHERGHGPLPANKAIIVDIFPRVSKTGYWGDITRTFVRGRPSDGLCRLYETVLAGQKQALDLLRDGCDGKKIQQGVKSFFDKGGYLTEQRDGRQAGFFHGLGHGVGLEIHEAPRFSSGVLKKGMVVTVEPGLYYCGLGGVRIEDLVVVEDKGCRNLTHFPKNWILR